VSGLEGELRRLVVGGYLWGFKAAFGESFLLLPHLSAR
jgi:hypothetical protein